MYGLGQSLTRPTIRVPTYWHLPNLDLSISTSRDVWNVRSQLQGANVRFGSLPDIGQPLRDIRFAPESRHGLRLEHVRYVPEADILRPEADWSLAGVSPSE